MSGIQIQTTYVIFCYVTEACNETNPKLYVCVCIKYNCWYVLKKSTSM